MENGNGQNLKQMNAKVKPLINDHLMKTTSVQRPNNYIPKMTLKDTTYVQRPPLYRYHLCTKTTWQLDSKDD